MNHYVWWWRGQLW